MKAELAAHLRRLGLDRGGTALRRVTEKRPVRGVESLLPGRLLRSDDSACFVTEQRYPLAQPHGTRPLGALLDSCTEVAAEMLSMPALAELSFRELLFLDTETTGLSGGTGTIAFLVGVGYFDGAQFMVRQYFLRSPGDEPAMLSGLAEQFSHRPGVVSFNGRGFDLPLLETRYILHRRPPPFLQAPHIDLLHPARRLWRDSLDSCSLISLEKHVLGVRRDQADVPSSVIPLIYRDYLRTGNGIEMPRIFYHNQVDVLSMVTLATQLCYIFERPAAELRDGLEWFALAKWYEALGMTAAAETAYRQAIESDLPKAAFQAALFRLARLLKRTGRRKEAAIVWQQLAVCEIDQVRAHVELAKYHEWHTRELERAADWTRRALSLVSSWPRGRRAAIRPELAHRLTRLGRRLARLAD